MPPRAISSAVRYSVWETSGSGDEPPVIGVAGPAGAAGAAIVASELSLFAIAGAAPRLPITTFLNAGVAASFGICA